MTSLYERLGGEAAVDAAVDRFYEKVLADPALAPFFADTNMARQRNHQKQFLTFAFGGPNHYSGRGMRNAHQRLVAEKGLNDTHFDAVVGHLGATLAELGVAPELVAEAAAIAETTRNDVLGRADAA